MNCVYKLTCLLMSWFPCPRRLHALWQAVITEAKPESAPAVCVIDTDCVVDFEEGSLGVGFSVASSSVSSAPFPLKLDVPVTHSVSEGATAYFDVFVPVPATSPHDDCKLTLTLVVGYSAAPRYALYAHRDRTSATYYCTLCWTPWCPLFVLLGAIIVIGCHFFFPGM